MNIVILATRISGTDGVSLEAERWREILVSMNHKVNFIAGQLDRAGILIPELHFQYPKVAQLHDKVIYNNSNYIKVEKEIFELAGVIEGKLREILRNGNADLLIVPNILSLPMHFPCAVAVSRIIEEFKIPTIARHHDFWWERARFNRSNMFEFFKRWFPYKSDLIKHVVINSIAQKELKKRIGVSSTVIADTFNFNSNLDKIDSFSKNWKKDFGIKDNETVFLQATRIVPRKKIEKSINLVKKLGRKNIILIIAGYSSDEGRKYENTLRRLVKETNIKCKFIGKRINSHRKIINKKRIYTLWDCFVNADFVTYPTAVEGFGNQFIESVYFKKPIFLTGYPVYKADIEPLGFTVAKNTKEVEKLLDDKKAKEHMVSLNYNLAKKHYSYEATAKKIKKLL